MRVLLRRKHIRLMLYAAICTFILRNMVGLEIEANYNYIKVMLVSPCAARMYPTMCWEQNDFPIT